MVGTDRVCGWQNYRQCGGPYLARSQCDNATVLVGGHPVTFESNCDVSLVIQRAGRGLRCACLYDDNNSYGAPGLGYCSGARGWRGKAGQYIAYRDCIVSVCEGVRLVDVC